MVKQRVAKKNPLYNKNKPILFDNIEEDAILRMTPNQEAEFFMSRWLELIDPIIIYSKYFKNSTITKDRIFHSVKIYFIRKVIESDWTEQKYVMVLDHMMRNNIHIIDKTIDDNGILFDEERLELQLREKRLKGRKRRL